MEVAYNYLSSLYTLVARFDSRYLLQEDLLERWSLRATYDSQNGNIR